MNDEQPTTGPQDDNFDDVPGDETDYPPDEYRLSTRPGVVSGGS